MPGSFPPRRTMLPVSQSSIPCVLDDRSAFARCLVAILATPEVTVEVSLDGADLLATSDDPSVSCVLIDLHLAGMSALTLVKRLRNRGMVLPAALISVNPSTGTIAFVAESGPVVTTSTAFEAFPATVDDLVLRRLRELRAALPTLEILRERMSRLTLREREIACLVAQGHSSKELALALNLSKRTVDNHRSRVLEKLQLDNFVQVTRCLPLLLGLR